jgi:hypothetical protein
MTENPIASVLGDPHKRTTAAQILGQAYVTAHHLMSHNKDKVERLAEALIERREMYGNELVEFLDDLGLETPAVDLRDETAWPKI